MRLESLMPSFKSSPRMRSAPQSLFSLAMRWIRSIVDSATRDGTARRRFDLHFHRSRKPSRCQRRTVFGLTMRVASRQVRQKALTNTITARSMVVSFGRRAVRLATMSCCLRRAFSASNSARVRNQSRARPAAAEGGRSRSRSASRMRPAAAWKVASSTANTARSRSARGRRTRLVMLGRTRQFSRPLAWC